MTANLLHKTKLKAFTEFLFLKGVAWRGSVAAYQVLQVRVENQWLPIYERVNSKQHYSIESRLEPLIREFIETTVTGRRQVQPAPKIQNLRPPKANPLVGTDFDELCLRTIAADLPAQNLDF